MLQFHTSKRLGTSFAVHGMVLADAHGLKLVFREADRPAELLEDNCQKLTIPWQEVELISGQTGWFGGRLRIRLRAGHGLTDVPFLHQDELLLEIHRSKMEELEPFLKRAEDLRRGHQVHDSDEVIEEVREMLDRHRGSFDEELS